VQKKKFFAKDETKMPKIGLTLKDKKLTKRVLTERIKKTNFVSFFTAIP